MAKTSKNLGLVQAIFVGTTPPNNITQLWHNLGDGLPYYYNQNTLQWEKLVTGGGGGGVSDNLYTADGTLSGNRTVTGVDSDLNIVLTGTGKYSLSSAVEVSIQGLIYPNSDGSPNYVLKTDGGGNLSFVDIASIISGSNGIYDGSGIIPTSVVATLTDTIDFIRGSSICTIGDTINHLDIDVPNGTNPLGLYGNRVGGALHGDNYALGFYYNDSLGVRTIGGSITTRVNGAPSAGNVNMDMVFNDHFKVQYDNRVLITPASLTKGPIAQLEVRGDATTPPAAFLVKTGGNTASYTAMYAQNLAGDSLWYIDATAKSFHNLSQLATGDFNARGGTDVNLLYVDAGLDKIGVGVATASISSKLTVNGDVETLTNTKGLIVLDRTDGNRYRIYTDGGVVKSELA